MPTELSTSAPRTWAPARSNPSRLNPPPHFPKMKSKRKSPRRRSSRKKTSFARPRSNCETWPTKWSTKPDAPLRNPPTSWTTAMLTPSRLISMTWKRWSKTTTGSLWTSKPWTMLPFRPRSKKSKKPCTPFPPNSTKPLQPKWRSKRAEKTVPSTLMTASLTRILKSLKTRTEPSPQVGRALGLWRGGRWPKHERSPHSEGDDPLNRQGSPPQQHHGSDGVGRGGAHHPRSTWPRQIAHRRRRSHDGHQRRGHGT